MSLSKRIRRNYNILISIILILVIIMTINISKNINKNNTMNEHIKQLTKNINENMVNKNNITLSEGTIVSLDTLEDIVTVLDVDGHAYEFYGTEDWFVKDGCIMLINNNGTDNRKDDIVLDVLYDMR